MSYSTPQIGIYNGPTYYNLDETMVISIVVANSIFPESKRKRFMFKIPFKFKKYEGMF